MARDACGVGWEVNRWMAKDRFLFWRSYYDALMLLDNSDAGRLVKAMCAFAFDERETDLSDSAALRLAWTMVSGEIRESVESGRVQAERGRRSGEARRAKSSREHRSEHRSEHCSEHRSNHGSNVSKYVSTSSDYASSLDAQTLVADEHAQNPNAGGDPRWDGVETSDPATAYRQAMAVLDMMESEQAGDGDG